MQILWILISFRLNHNTPSDKIVNKLLILICCFVSFVVCYGRVYLLYHSVKQVIIGLLVGATFGSLWFTLVHFVISPFLFPKIVSWKISEFLLIRDTTLIPGIIFFEYTSTRHEARQRSRKKNWMIILCGCYSQNSDDKKIKKFCTWFRSVHINIFYHFIEFLNLLPIYKEYN